MQFAPTGTWPDPDGLRRLPCRRSRSAHRPARRYWDRRPRRPRGDLRQPPLLRVERVVRRSRRHAGRPTYVRLRVGTRQRLNLVWSTVHSRGTLTILTFVLSSPTTDVPAGGIFTHLTRTVDWSRGGTTFETAVAAPVAMSDGSATAMAARTCARRFRFTRLPLLSSYAGPGGCQWRAARVPRMILENGAIRTMDPSLPLARALAIAGERIAGGVGTHELALASPEVDRPRRALRHPRDHRLARPLPDLGDRPAARPPRGGDLGGGRRRADGPGGGAGRAGPLVPRTGLPRDQLAGAADPGGARRRHRRDARRGDLEGLPRRSG